MTKIAKTISDEVVWSGRPWITPALAVRTVGVVVVLAIVLFLESFVGVFHNTLVMVPVWLLTATVFGLLWLVGIFDLVVLRASNSYILRQDGLEVKRGILRLHTFIVTPQGFGDLMANQSIGGRILDYGDLMVDSQGEKKTRLQLIRRPTYVADLMREIMGKPIVRVEEMPQKVPANPPRSSQ